MGKQFTETFKTITCQNGCKNLYFEGIEDSVRNKIKRTKVNYQIQHWINNYSRKIIGGLSANILEQKHIAA